MSEDKKEDTPHITFLNQETNLLETRNAITGELLAMQRSMDENILCAKEKRAHLVVVDGREVLVEAGVELNEIPFRVNHKTQWVYSTLIGEMICQLIVEGFSMAKISRTPGFPPVPTIARWKKTISSFKKMVEQAYIDRGEYHRDRVLELIEEDPIIYNKEGNPVIINEEIMMRDSTHLKIQIDGHKWLAGTDNADKFGNKTKVEGEVGVKHTVFMVDTGIRRPDDVGYNKDMVRIVQDSQQKRLEDKNGSRQESSAPTEVIGEQAPDVGSDSLSLKPKI